MRERLPYNLLAKPGIENKAAAIFDFDFAEVSMFWIEKKRSFVRDNDAGHSQNSRPTRPNPFVANLF